MALVTFSFGSVFGKFVKEHLGMFPTQYQQNLKIGNRNLKPET